MGLVFMAYNTWKYIGLKQEFGEVVEVQLIRCGKNSDDKEFTSKFSIKVDPSSSEKIKAFSSSELETWVNEMVDVSIIDEGLVVEGTVPNDAKNAKPMEEEE